MSHFSVPEDSVMSSLPGLCCIAAGLYLALFGQALAPLGEDGKERLSEASRGPFWASAFAAGLLLWMSLAPSLATPEAPFFYHLGLITALLGGAVAGVFTLFLPRLCTRLQLGTLMSLAFSILVDSEEAPPVGLVSGVFNVLAVASLAVARPAHETWVMVGGTSLAGALLAALGLDALWGCGLFDAVAHVARSEWPYDPSSSLFPNGSLRSAVALLWLLTAALGVASQGWAFGLFSPSSTSARAFRQGPTATTSSTAASNTTVAAAAAQGQTGRGGGGSASLAAGGASGGGGGGSAPYSLSPLLSAQSQPPSGQPHSDNSRLLLAAAHNSVGDEDAFNYVNPAQLSERYKGLCARFLFANADALMFYFGFQVDNVRGQVEHVLMLLASMHKSPSSASAVSASASADIVNQLHSKVFRNYLKWCKHLDVRPQFSPPPPSSSSSSSSASSPPAPGTVGGKPADVLLWFLIWGEAANLRHMPESLAFLYHKAMTSWRRSVEGAHTSLEQGQRYPGHFLDHTVAPLYKVLKRSATVKRDHPEKRNYDDFNEFFWTPVCLDCCYTDDPRSPPPPLPQPTSSPSSESEGSVFESDDGLSLQRHFVADALGVAKKSYLEKRSWFHVFLNFRRVYEFLVVTFQLLVCLAFGELLVWDWSFQVQMCSSVLLTLNLLQVVWSCLLAWVALPAKDPTSAAMPDLSAAMGHLLALAARYTLLVFQVLYFTWSMDRLMVLAPLRAASSGQASSVAEEQAFWWWQFVWVSAVALFGYFVEASLQLVPWLAACAITGGVGSAAAAAADGGGGSGGGSEKKKKKKMKTGGVLSRTDSSGSSSSGNDWWASFLHINFPSSRLYVGKEVVEKWRNALTYQLYWLTLLCFKFWFGYVFLVQPAALPTLQLFDDMVNYPSTYGFYLTAVLMGCRWVPSMLVYAIDLSIWYALWSGVVGMYMGMEEGVGVVKTFAEIRESFMLCPSAFCSKLVSQKALPSVTKQTETDLALRNRRRRTLANRVGSGRQGSGGGGEGGGAGVAVAAAFNGSSCGGDHGGGSGGGMHSMKSMAMPNFKSALNLSQMLEDATATVGSGASGSVKGVSGLVSSTAGERGGLLAGKGSSFSGEAQASKTASGVDSKEYLRSYVNEFLDSHAIKGRQWVIFAAAWNEIIDSMRWTDTISNSEQSLLTFDTFQGFRKPIYLPVFQTAGLVEQASALCSSTFAAAREQQLSPSHHLSSGGGGGVGGGQWTRKVGEVQCVAGALVLQAMERDVCMREALTEAWELSSWLLTQLLGPTHAADMKHTCQTVDKWVSFAEGLGSSQLHKSSSGTLREDALPTAAAAASGSKVTEGKGVPALFNVVSFEHVDRFRVALTNLVKTLKGALSVKRKKPPPSKRNSQAPQPSSHASALNSHSLNSTSSERLGMRKLSQASASTSSLVELAASTTSEEAVRDYVGSPLPKGKKLFALPSTRFQQGPSDHTSSSDHLNQHGYGDVQRDAVREALKQLFDALKGLVLQGPFVAPAHAKSAASIQEALRMIRQYELGFFWDDQYASDCLDAVAADALVDKVTTKLHALLAIRSVDAEPKSDEAKRRLTFFVNSLFMDMPKAPAVPDMRSFSVMTPFYAEDVIYTKADLEHENSDGITVLLYLQTLYGDDWRNFLERNQISDPARQIWQPQHLMATRLWASLRAQTLARTVLGMMHYEAALRLLAQLERFKSLTSAASATATLTADGSSSGGQVEDAGLEEVLALKFSYVVACQVYGKMKKSQDSKASDIEFLLHKFPNLRVAYIDEKPLNRQGAAQFYSCLIKSSGGSGGGGEGNPDGVKAIQTVYRVKLPGNPCIGEGKPENQNHAMIFTRGEFIQAIDMNQDGFFEEALKHRNLLEEFGSSNNAKALPITILGFREHIFTGGVSSVANYMALQEASFVTTGQRVLNKPLCVRLHYGHPDLFDKLFFMQNGGMSKASAGINLSEDVFAGYSASVRGGSVDFKEYAQVGKGRDVGLQQIYKFEAKLAQGNAEQCLSRDVDRLFNRLDFFRLLSAFFGGIGHYVNSTLTVFTIITVTYLIALTALFGYEKVGDELVVVLGSVQIMLAGMGVLQTLPLMATLTVEKGLWGAVVELVRVFGSGGPFYFIFHIQTRAYYFFQTLVAGGAQYRATGRGFVTRHAHFDENWRFFASSHIYLGIEILAALGVFACYTETKQVWGHGWSMFLAAMAFVWTPYWFNPLAFNWQAVKADYSQWLLWITVSSGGSAAHSWMSWWIEEKGYLVRLRAAEKTTVLWRAFIYVVLALGVCGWPDNFTGEKLARFAHMVVVTGALFLGVLYSDWLGGCIVHVSPRFPPSPAHRGGGTGGYEPIGSSGGGTTEYSGGLRDNSSGGSLGTSGSSGGSLGSSASGGSANDFASGSYDDDDEGGSGSGAGGGPCCSPRPNALTRFLKPPLTVATLFSAAYFLNKDPFLIQMCVGLYYLLAAVYTVGVVLGWTCVAQLLRCHDLLWGHLMFLPLFVLAALQLPDKIQTWLLYHNALSEGVLIDTILKQARRSQQSDNSNPTESPAGGAATQAAAAAGAAGGGASSGAAGVSPAALPGSSSSSSPLVQPQAQPASVEMMEEMRRMLNQQQLVITQLSKALAGGVPAGASARDAVAADGGGGFEMKNYTPVSTTPAPTPAAAEAQTGPTDPEGALRQTTIGENFVFRGAGPVG